MMKSRYFYIIFLISIVIYIGAAFAGPVPGYMDAAYYYSGGVSLANGVGFFEPFLWNYLNNPDVLPNPSHTYWMPLASILTGFSIMLLGSEKYFTARFPFIIIASLVPVVTMVLTVILDKPKHDRQKGRNNCLFAEKFEKSRIS